jgi:hypothetical protein
VKKSSHHRRRTHAAGEQDTAGSVETGRPLPTSGGGLPGEAGEAVLQNDLITDSALQIIDRLRPHFTTLLAAAGAALAAALAFAIISAQKEASRAQSWEGCLAALSSGEPTRFEEVARRYPGTDAARWAELMLADFAAAEGADLLFVDRQRAEGRLQAAVEMYSALMTTRPRGLLAERAVFGLAKARESLGQLAESQRGYEAVAAEFSGDPIAKLAAGRAAELGRDATRQWYDWFASQKITPPGVPAAGSPSQPAAAAPPANVVPESAPAAGQP